MARWLVAGAVAAALVVSGCSGASSRPSEGRLTAHGDVLVTPAAGPTRPVRGSVTLHSGDEVRVRQGDASVALSRGTTVALRTGSVVRFAGGPQLVSGDLLADSPARPVAIGAGVANVSVEGAGRLHRDLVLVVGAYRGAATVTTATRPLVVPALRQAAVAAIGLLPERPAPLTLNPQDAWDREYLGTAIDLTSQLNASSQGFTAEVAPGDGQTAAFYRRALVPLDHQPAFSDSLLRSTATTLGPRPPGEMLVGVAIALTGGRGSFTQRWQQVWDFRDQGAAWGLVALDQANDGARLLSLIGQAIGSTLLVFTAPVPSSPSSGLDNGAALLAPSPRRTSTPTTQAKPRTPTTPPPTTTPPSGPLPVPTGPLPTLPPPSPLGAVLDPVLQLGNSILAPVPAAHR